MILREGRSLLCPFRNS